MPMDARTSTPRRMLLAMDAPATRRSSLQVRGHGLKQALCSMPSRHVCKYAALFRVRSCLAFAREQSPLRCSRYNFANRHMGYVFVAKKTRRHHRETRKGPPTGPPRELQCVVIASCACADPFQVLGEELKIGLQIEGFNDEAFHALDMRWIDAIWFGEK